MILLCSTLGMDSKALVRRVVARHVESRMWGQKPPSDMARAIDVFKKDFDVLVRGKQQKMQGALVSDVAQLFKKLQKALPNYEFVDGATPESVAKRFIHNVFQIYTSGLEDPYSNLSLKEFFTKGEAHLAPVGTGD